MYTRLLKFLFLACIYSIVNAMEISHNEQMSNALQSNTDNDSSDIKDHFIIIPLHDVENDLTENNWVEIINAIILKLQGIYHPDIHAGSINHFKKSMANEYSFVHLKQSLKDSFGIGHLGIARDKIDLEQIRKIRIEHSQKRSLKTLIYYIGPRIGYLYDHSRVAIQDIYDYENKFKRISVTVQKSDNGDVPIVAVPSFDVACNDISIILEDISTMTLILGRKYNHIIVNLLENNGGDVQIMYYFISFLLGNNDPDIYTIFLNDTFGKHSHISYEQLETMINNTKLKPFYEYVRSAKKNISEDITFKKMIVLVNGNTFSGGEIAAAALKSTLGSKVCILGEPCVGSFEISNDAVVSLPYDFKLFLPQNTTKVFYSRKLCKLLTGCRLLPDIVHENMSTIVDKALSLLHDSSSFPENPSFERTYRI
jgi:hypothetical protein